MLTPVMSRSEICSVLLNRKVNPISRVWILTLPLDASIVMCELGPFNLQQVMDSDSFSYSSELRQRDRKLPEFRIPLDGLLRNPDCWAATSDSTEFR